MGSPVIATFSVAAFERRRVPGLVAGVPLERLHLRRQPGLAWGRHLGTSAAERTLGADATRWAWFCAWDGEAAAAGWHAKLARHMRPAELATLHLRTTRSRGSWGGHRLAPWAGGAMEPASGPIVVLTRARVRASRWRAFAGAVPPVDADLAAAPGRLRSVGVGEWPVLVQGTVSVWENEAAIADFARRTTAHREAIRRTRDEGWYAEELFARFAVAKAEGAWDGSDLQGSTGRF